MTGSAVISSFLSLTVLGVEGCIFLPFLGQGLGVEYSRVINGLRIGFSDWGGFIAMQ